MSASKVQLLRWPDPCWRNPHEKSIEVRELAPFVWRASQSYVHRPRSATIYNDAAFYRHKRRDGKPWSTARLAVNAWCGQILQRPSASEYVPPGRELCATCDARATANGHPTLDGNPVDPRLTFRPIKQQPWGMRPARYDTIGYRIRLSVPPPEPPQEPRDAQA